MKVEDGESHDSAVADGPGARTAFEILYRDYFEAIYAYVLRRVSGADTADLVADVFATAWRRIDDVPPGPDSKMWLYGVARRTLSQHYRSKSRGDRLKSKLLHNTPTATSGDLYESSDLDVQVRRLIESLNDDDRELVTLIVWDGLPHAEVAMILAKILWFYFGFPAYNSAIDDNGWSYAHSEDWLYQAASASLLRAK